MPSPVTVLMTVFNGLPYLGRAIESVLDQSFTDFEFLIIDDASTDESVACIQSYGDPRIRLVCNEQNLGQARSLNKGLQLARGRYIARLDQDDLCLGERLEKQVAVLDARPEVAVVGTWTYFLDSEGKRTGPFGGEVANFGSLVSCLLFTGGCPFFHPSVMFRRSVVTGLGGYDPAFAPAEDVDLWVRLVMARCDGYVLPEPLLVVRTHQGQQSIAKAEIQSKNGDRARQKLLDAFCGGRDIRLVELLLRMDDTFWSECRKSADVRSVLETLGCILNGMRKELKLSREEYAVLSNCVCRWLGGGARAAILRRHRQSLPLYLFALRGDLRAMQYPSILFYPVLYVLSPLFFPRVRQVLEYLAEKIGRLKPAGRGLVAELRR